MKMRHRPMGDLEILGKLVGATILAGILGWDREEKSRPAGLRTHMLVAISATLFVVLAEWMVRRMGESTNVTMDPSRAIEAIVAGVSFLGAGTIFVSRGKERVHGLTTAAGLLTTAAIGAAVALERYVIAVGTTAIVFTVMRFFLYLETRWSPSPRGEARQANGRGAEAEVFPAPVRVVAPTCAGEPSPERAAFMGQDVATRCGAAASCSPAST